MCSEYEATPGKRLKYPNKSLKERVFLKKLCGLGSIQISTAKGGIPREIALLATFLMCVWGIKGCQDRGKLARVREVREGASRQEEMSSCDLAGIKIFKIYTK